VFTSLFIIRKLNLKSLIILALRVILKRGVAGAIRSGYPSRKNPNINHKIFILQDMECRAIGHGPIRNKLMIPEILKSGPGIMKGLVIFA
jgi:hypothetical protein